MSRAFTALSFLLVVLWALALAVWEAFHVAALPFGHPLPFAGAVAVAGNLVLGVAGARVLRRPVGAVVPGVVWLVVALLLGAKRAEGDVVVTDSGRGLAFLLAGTAAAAVAVGLAGGNRRTGATPSG